MQRTITIAFLRPTRGDDRMNDLTARFSKHGVCHAELVFEGGQAFSIFSHGTAALRQRSMSNPGYELVSLSVPATEYRACHQFCQSAHTQAYPFDSWGMYLSLVHPGECAHKSSERVGKTFCSKIITEALQFGGVREVQGLSPSAVTPSSLLSAVKDSERRVCHTVRSLAGAGALVPMLMMH